MKDKLDALPDRPGVYLFKNSADKIVYIGKAKSLKNRVRSYFTGRDDGRPQYPKLVAAIRDFEIILTRSELEALIT
ncbi:MAG: GIY-YIG nuclease family protein [Candidatus Electryoneaceae bacterium]|nr:GIY-YIG nuclease family protein [Candidatus Electryoneaceae bacterium]